MTTTRTGRAAALVCAAVLLVGLSLAGPAAGTSIATPSDTPSTTSTAGPSSGFPSTVTTSAGVEVTTYGTVKVRPYQDQGGGQATVALHAVQRVDGGTVVYFSVGWDDEAGELAPVSMSEIVGTQIGGRYSGGGAVSGVRVVERSAGRVLSTLREPERGVLTGPFASRSESFPTEPGQMAALFAVLPELDPATETVDVQLAYGLTVPDVPVGDGLLEPGVPADEVVPLGEGWPEVDLDEVAAAPEPELSVHELVTVVQALDLTTTTTTTTEQVSIDVAADVLFAFDSAELTPEATATLQAVGADVVARAAGGTLQVLGHTDSQGSDAYNQDLSQRRAQAAAAILTPFAQQVGLQVAVEGRGESEPVADNGTDPGRQANRRVTVTFDVAEGAQP